MGHSRRLPLLRLCTLAALVVTGFAAGAPGQSAENVTARYFEGLRQRRLFGLAEGYCLDRLAEPTLSPEQKALLTLELSRTFAEHARYTTGEEQAELWERATAALDDFLAKEPRNPRRILVAIQRALLPAAQGEYLRGQWELQPQNEALARQARDALTDSSARLAVLEKQLTEQVGRPGPRTGGAPPHELRGWLANVRFRLGAAHLDLAKLSPSASPDRAAALLDAEEWLRPIARGLPGEELTWSAQLFLAEANRLRGDTQQAALMLAAIEKEKPPQPVIDRIVALRVELLLDIDKVTEAADLLVRYGRSRGGLTAEQRFLQVKSTVALWEIAVRENDTQLAADLQKELETLAARAEQEIGGYWGYRCRLLVQSAGESAEYGPDLAPAIRAAQAAYHAGRIEDALKEYAQAFDAARKTGRKNVAMELGFTRASIALEAGRLSEAATDFARLAADFPEEKRAAEAHLLSAYALGRLYEQRSTQERREAFTAALLEHRQRYAASPTVHEASWMLALLEEKRLQTTRALPLYKSIPADHRRGPEAQAAVARCYETLLDRIRDSRDLRAEWEQRAATDLEAIVGTFSAEPAALTPIQAETALRFARILLNRLDPDFAKAERLLAHLFAAAEQHRTAAGENEGPMPARDPWQPLVNTAAQLRIVSLAGQGGWNEAAALVERLSSTSPDEVLKVLDGLHQLSAGAEDRVRRGLGELQLRAAEALAARPGELTAEQQARLDRCLAQAYVATGQPKKAIEVYERLLARAPKDRALLRSVAELLGECGTRECLTAALGHWRKLESLEKAGEPAWFAARIAVARTLYALGEYAECRKLLGVTRLLYPELGGPEQRTAFETLERQVAARTKT